MPDDVAAVAARVVSREGLDTRWHTSLQRDALALAREVQRQADEIKLVRGAMAADDDRLRRAAERVGVTWVGCDTADAMADEIELLTTELARLRYWHHSIAIAQVQYDNAVKIDKAALDPKPGGAT